tara:strand:+ start:1416 stop:1541 length:126 start_codon:yes stop_codon:yes gene_type:complete
MPIIQTPNWWDTDSLNFALGFSVNGVALSPYLSHKASLTIS